LIKLPEPYLRAGSFHPELYLHDASYSMSSILGSVSAGVLSKKYLELVKSMLNDFYFMVGNYGYVLNGIELTIQ
jgi:neutral trehalase